MGVELSARLGIECKAAKQERMTISSRVNNIAGLHVEFELALRSRVCGEAGVS
jgi:hypothetical protein